MSLFDSQEMAPCNSFNRGDSRCRTPDPPSLHSDSWAQKGAYFFEDNSRGAASRGRTPDRVANLNVKASGVKLQELQSSSAKCFEDIELGPPPGLTPFVNKCLDGDAMKLVANSDLSSVRQPFMEEQVASKGSVGHPHYCPPAWKWGQHQGGFSSKVHAVMQPKPETPTQVHAGMLPKPEPLAGVGLKDSKLKEAQSLVNKLVALLGGEEPFGSKPKHSKASMTTATQLSSRVGFGAVACDMQVREAKDSSSGASFSAVAQDEQGSIVNPSVVISINELIKTPPVLSTNPTFSQSQKEMPASQASNQIPPLEASVGSRGHPHGCRPACKYLLKPKGCKDGRQCIHCHLCRWTRHSVRTGCKQPMVR